MKNNDPLSKSTVDLLRAPLPDTAPRPGFETRLICNLKTASTGNTRRFSWLPFAAAAVLIALLAALPLLQTPTPAPSNLTTNPPPPPVETPRPVLELDHFAIPLRKEATALTDTATRAGQFLIHCLPSLPDPEGTL